MDYNSVKQKIETIIDKLDNIPITSLSNCSDTKLELLQIKLEFIEKLIAEKKDEIRQMKLDAW